MEESGKTKMTPTARRTATTRIDMGRVKVGRATVNGVNQPGMSPKPLGAKRKVWNSTSTTAVVIAKQQQQQRHQQQGLEISPISDPTSAVSNSNHDIRSPTQVLKKTRSEPLKEVSSTNETQLIKGNSENWDRITNSNSPNRSPTSNNVAAHSSNMNPKLTLCDSDQHDLLDNNVNDSDNTQDQDVMTTFVNTCGTEEVKMEAVQVSPKEKIINTSSDHVDDHKLDVKHEEKNELVDSSHDKHSETHDQGSSDDKLIQLDLSKKSPLKNKTKKELSPSATNSSVGLSTGAKSIPSPHPSTTTPTSTPTSTTACCKPLSPRSKSTLSAPTSTTTREDLNEYDTSTIPETHSKLQTLVDLVMWRDVAKSAFIFGFGTFIIISSSYAKDFNFSLISAGSYISLVYLVVVFLYKSFMRRGLMDREDWRRENYVMGEEEAVWLVKLVLPYLNEFLLKLRGFFSGDPAVTMKLAVVLFVLARCGSSITVWKMLKLSFFGVFVIPKLCSSYSTQITAHAKFWVGRFRDAWESCSHKKALAFAVFTIIWNFSSVVARAWAAFMLFVAFRYYQQSLISDDFVEVKEQTGLHAHNVQRRQHLARQRRRIATSLDQEKQKKNF
ncbi:reticulon-like protein B21 [Chenopodium quinoa]|uniref:reticulon-like protein B21 n=1 Tax=Chenopodium quinoa TaxID=63459 RepID=UPI000B795310|nr:reticulon-like protein B21 [Chenopodium quinoa]